jgi:integral membrane protein
MTGLLKTSIGRFRIIGILEGASLLLLFGVAMPVKYILGNPSLVQSIGMIHGLLFILYVLLTISMRGEYNWNNKTTAKVLLASVIPFGTFYIDGKVLKRLAVK